MPEKDFISSLLRFSGLGGRGLQTDSPLPQPPVTPSTADKTDINFTESGKVGDPDVWASYNAAMTRPVTFESTLQLWDQMSSWDMLSAALVEIVDEATQSSQTDPGALWFECSDRKIEAEVNRLVEDLDIQSLIPSQIWHIAGFGNSFEHLDYSRGEGVTGMSYVHPMDVRRLWLERNRKCIGYRWRGHKPDKSAAFMDNDGREISHIGLAASGKEIEDLYYPWDFLHFRRMYKMRLSEHGEPVFSDAQGIYKKLKLAIDQMVIYRAQVQPDRYAINVDVQEQPPQQQMRTVQRWKQMLRRKVAYGEGDGKGGDTDFTAFNNPMALDSVLWLAQPKGYQHSITKLPGTPSVPDVYDIEMLINLFFAVIGMPRWWIMGQQGNENPASGRSLMATDMRFLRKIKTLRRPLQGGYEWLANLHLVLRNTDVSDKVIRARMSEIGSLDEQIKIDILTAQVEAMDKMADVMAKLNIPPEEWVDLILKDYLSLPADVVDMVVTNLPPEVEARTESGPRMSRSKILDEILNKHGDTVNELKSKLRPLINGRRVQGTDMDPRARKSMVENLLKIPAIMDSDRAASGFGKTTMVLAPSLSLTESRSGTESRTFSLTEDAEFGSKTAHANAVPGHGIHPAYRDFIS